MTTLCRRWFRVRAPGAGRERSALRQLVAAGAGFLVLFLTGCAANTCPLAAGVGLPCEDNRWEVEGIPNLGRVTWPGRPDVFRFGQPETVEQWRMLREHVGLTDVLELNFAAEGRNDLAAAVGIRVHRVPIPPSTQRYLSVFEQPTPQQLAEIIGYVMQMRTPGTVWGIHCVNGHDRTGLAVMLVRMLVDGWNPLQAYAEALQWGYHPQLWLDRTRHEFSNQTK